MLAKWSAVRRVLHDRRAASAIELALVMPMLLLLLAGMVEVSRFVVARLDVELAAQRTTDFALARRPQSADPGYLRAEAARAADVPQSDVTAELFLECDGVRQDDFDATCDVDQISARYVNISIAKQVDTQFNWEALTMLFGVTVIGSQITVTGNSLERIQ